jgi:hypothetical protein
MSGNVQHRPGQSVYKRNVHADTSARQHPHQHGWPGPGAGQRLHRTPVAQREVRRRVSAGLRRWPGAVRGTEALLRLLQLRAPSQQPGQTHPGWYIWNQLTCGKSAPFSGLLHCSLALRAVRLRRTRAPFRNPEKAKPARLPGSRREAGPAGPEEAW